MFGEPDVDWAEDYDWTRYRGPTVYPCPAGWVLDTPEGLAYGWKWYPGVGNGVGTETELFKEFEPEYESYDEAREGRAFLIGTVVESNLKERTETVEWELTIDGESVFKRLDPDMDEMFGAVAVALSRYANDEDVTGVCPETGDLPAEIVKERETESKAESNHHITEFE